MLSLAYILPTQAQKHVTHNEVLPSDKFLQSVIDALDVQVPPNGVTEG